MRASWRGGLPASGQQRAARHVPGRQVGARRASDGNQVASLAGSWAKAEQTWSFCSVVSRGRLLGAPRGLRAASGPHSRMSLPFGRLAASGRPICGPHALRGLLWRLSPARLTHCHQHCNRRPAPADAHRKPPWSVNFDLWARRVEAGTAVEGASRALKQAQKQQQQQQWQQQWQQQAISPSSPLCSAPLRPRTASSAQRGGAPARQEESAAECIYLWLLPRQFGSARLGSAQLNGTSTSCCQQAK